MITTRSWLGISSPDWFIDSDAPQYWLGRWTAPCGRTRAEEPHSGGDKLQSEPTDAEIDRRRRLTG